MRAASGRPARRSGGRPLDHDRRSERNRALRGSLGPRYTGSGSGRSICPRRWWRRHSRPRTGASIRTRASTRSPSDEPPGATCVARGRAEGGSTMTQQVAKLLLDRRALLASRAPRPRGWHEKIHEAVVALRLEHRLAKQDILALYLNLAPYANQIAGAERASRAYFGTSAAMLTPAQAAFLAALPQRPSRFNPWRSFPQALARQRAVLDRMERRGYPHPGSRHQRARRAPPALRRSASASSLRISWGWCSRRCPTQGRRASSRRSTPNCSGPWRGSCGASTQRWSGTGRRTSRLSCSTTTPPSGWRGRGPATSAETAAGPSTGRWPRASPGRP